MPPTSSLNYGGAGEAVGQDVEEENTSLRAISKYLMQERQELLCKLQVGSLLGRSEVFAVWSCLWPRVC